MASITIKNKNGETLDAFESFTARECEALRILGHVVPHAMSLVGSVGFAGKEREAEIQSEVTFTVSELRKVQNNPERIAKAIEAGYSFIVAKGQDKYTPSVRKYDVYIGANDARAVSSSQECRDMSDDIWAETKTVFELTSGDVSGRVYDFEALTEAEAQEYVHNDNCTTIDYKIAHLQGIIDKLGESDGRRAFMEALERAKANGFTHIRFGLFTHNARRVEFVTDRIITAKPETVARRKLSADIKRDTGIDLYAWQLKALEEAGYRIVKAKKARKDAGK